MREIQGSFRKISARAMFTRRVFRPAVKIGTRFMVLPGERIPLDGRIVAVRQADEISRQIKPAEDWEEFKGRGMRGQTEGKDIWIGSRQFMEEHGLGIPQTLDAQGLVHEQERMTVVYFGWQEKSQGFLAFGDSLRQGAPELVRKVLDKGIEVWMISGDAAQTTAAVARSLGIERYRGRTSPAQKAELIQSLQHGGHRVGMVGDGINDAAALAQSDVGFALGTGSNILREASDITLLGEEPGRVLEVFDLAGRMSRTIRQNLFFSFFYNLIGIPVAASGLLNPLIAVFAMFLSSLTVIGNSLRLTRQRGKNHSAGG